MSSFRVELGAASHEVHVGVGLLDHVGELARAAGLEGRCAVVTDSNVGPLYLKRCMERLAGAGFEPMAVEVAAGEASKSLATLERIYDRLVDVGLQRSSALFALGGGVVGDLTGFAAATFMRGVPLVELPTTVLAQVDSALGGKTGVNHPRAKNLLGAFYQPRLIVADVSLLVTLPDREFREGLAEVIKYGAIMDESLIEVLERDLERLLERDLLELERIVERSLRHKAAVVESDEREAGRRAILNFGHTIGHALENASGYGEYLHGEAVAIGMAAAAGLSRRFAGLSASHERRLIRIIDRAGLPIALPSTWLNQRFRSAMALDKKRVGSTLQFILLERLGQALIRPLTWDEVVAGLTSSQ